LQTVAKGNGSVPGDVVSWLAGVYMSAACHGDDEGCVKPQELSAKITRHLFILSSCSMAMLTM
jgi:hypothetical protein